MNEIIHRKDANKCTSNKNTYIFKNKIEPIANKSKDPSMNIDLPIRDIKIEKLSTKFKTVIIIIKCMFIIHLNIIYSMSK